MNAGVTAMVAGNVQQREPEISVLGSLLADVGRAESQKQRFIVQTLFLTCVRSALIINASATAMVAGPAQERMPGMSAKGSYLEDAGHAWLLITNFIQETPTLKWLRTVSIISADVTVMEATVVQAGQQEEYVKVAQ